MADSACRGKQKGRPEAAFPAGQRPVLQVVRCYFTSSAIAAPRSPGERTVLTPAASIAANLPSAVPLPPDAIAPAWPMRLPAGADAPAMKPTTGFLTWFLMYSAP